MKRIIGLAITVLVAAGSSFASGGIRISISTNQEQFKADVKEFHYRRSPRELADALGAAMIADRAAPSVHTPGGGRNPRDDPRNDPVTIVRFLDSWSQRFKIAAFKHEVFSSVVFEYWRPLGGRTEVYQTVRLTNAVVYSFESYTIGYDPRETIKFTFEKIEYENKGGSAAVPATWDWIAKEHQHESWNDHCLVRVPGFICLYATARSVSQQAVE